MKMMIGKLRPLLAASFLLVFVTVNCSLAQPVIDRIRSNRAIASIRSDSGQIEGTPRRQPTPRPTFTPTPAYTATPTHTPTPTITPIPSDTPTPLPTNTPLPTDTPAPTDTPEPTKTPRPVPPTATFTPAPSPTPDYPFRVAEQGNREFQKTNYNGIVVFVAAVDANNTPIGGLKVVGDHTPSGMHLESPLTDWRYSAVNCLGCSYVKQGNVKFEPGPFTDGTWNIYLADGGGGRVSPTVSLSYSSSPDQWVWDFIIFKKK